MIESEKKILEAFLSKALKLDSEAIASLYNEAGELTDLKVLEEADQQRIKSLKDNSDNQYKRGLKEGASKIETELRSRYSVESENIGIDLVDDILVAEIEKVKGSAKDDISSHPKYLELIAENKKAIKAREDEWKKKFDDREGELKRDRVISKAKKKALDILKGLNPILPEDGNKAQKWQEKYLDELVSNIDLQEHEDDLILMREGKQLQDEHGYNTSFNDYAAKVASDLFEFKKADDRSSAANKDTDGGGAFRAPKDREEYTKMIQEAKTPEERVKILESFKDKLK